MRKGNLLVAGNDLLPVRPARGMFASATQGGNRIKGGEWAKENPVSTREYPRKYGLPAENSGKPDWVVKGCAPISSPQGPAPPGYNAPYNIGGAIEVRPMNPDAVMLEWLHMPD